MHVQGWAYHARDAVTDGQETQCLWAQVLGKRSQTAEVAMHDGCMRTLCVSGQLRAKMVVT